MTWPAIMGSYLPNIHGFIIDHETYRYVKLTPSHVWIFISWLTSNYVFESRHPMNGFDQQIYQSFLIIQPFWITQIWFNTQIPESAKGANPWWVSQWCQWHCPMPVQCCFALPKSLCHVLWRLSRFNSRTASASYPILTGLTGMKVTLWLFLWLLHIHWIIDSLISLTY